MLKPLTPFLTQVLKIFILNLPLPLSTLGVLSLVTTKSSFGILLKAPCSLHTFVTPSHWKLEDEAKRIQAGV